jgi:hypothetical protein
LQAASGQPEKELSVPSRIVWRFGLASSPIR